MRLTLRIALGLAALVLIVAALAVQHRRVVRELAEGQRDLSEGRLETLLGTDELRRRVDRISELSRKLAVLRDPAYVAALVAARASFEGELAALAESASASSAQPAIGEPGPLARLREAWAAYSSTAPELEAAVRAGRGRVAFEEHLATTLEVLRATLDDVEADSRAAVARRLARSSTQAARAERAAWAVGAAAVALALLVAALVVLPLRTGLRRLRSGTEELARGRFDHRVEASGGSELAALAVSFNAMAERLAELDRLKRDFVSAVSHDLKAPLASMEETLTLLLEEGPGPLTDRQRRLLDLCRSSGARLRRMIGDLLDLARLDAGVWERPPADCDLSRLVREDYETLEARAADREIRVEWDLRSGRVRAEVDAPAVRRLLDNLWDNALKHTPAGGSVGLSLREVEGVREFPARVRELGPPPSTRGVLVEVWDTGPGLPEADLERIFERFQRGPSRAGRGTGLGLAIARAIARAHGGELWCEPGARGGSRFVLFLWPRPEPPGPAEPSP